MREIFPGATCNLLGESRFAHASGTSQRQDPNAVSIKQVQDTIDILIPA
jgi:hypothetical protein